MMDAPDTYLANSRLVANIQSDNFLTSSTIMNARRTYDGLNRLQSITNFDGAGVPLVAHAYEYNTANQRTAVTNADGARWAWQYDKLGQVVAGKKRWADGQLVAGQQFEYAFDELASQSPASWFPSNGRSAFAECSGNRKTAARGGDQWGANLRYQNYTANNLNQYTQRTVPPFMDVLGSATNIATVTVNLKSTQRHGDYFRAELNPDNSVNPVHLSATNVAVLILCVRLLPPGAWHETGMRSARELVRLFAGRGFCGMLKWP